MRAGHLEFASRCASQTYGAVACARQRLGVAALAGIALVATLLDGCAGLRTAQSESPNLYVLEAKSLTKAARAKRDVVLEVSGPRAWPGFDTPEMAYVQRPYELDHFAASRWVDTPSRMLAPLLVQVLQQTESFKAVMQSPSVVASDVRLDVELVRLQQDFQTRPSRIELTLRVQIIDSRGRRVLASRLLEETENAPSDDAYGGVIAANAALQRVLEHLADFCVLESGSR